MAYLSAASKSTAIFFNNLRSNQSDELKVFCINLNTQNFFEALGTTVGGMKRSGMRGCEPIPRYKPCLREQNLQIALKPLCFMTACWQQ